MEPKKIDVWLDCDPGVDDMFAIFLINGHPIFNLIGVSTSPGNTNLQNTTQNALDILHGIGKSHIPVVKGTNRQLTTENKMAQHVHGSNGLMSVALHKSPKEAQSGLHNIYKRLIAFERKITFINTGSMTNLALLLHTYPDLRQKIEHICVMGGAIGAGNITPAAQFNFYYDPVAVKQVLRFGIKFTMVPLETTSNIKVTQQIINKLKEFKSDFGQKVYQIILNFIENWKSFKTGTIADLHDPSAIFYLISPESFKFRPAEIVIDTNSISSGRSNCEFRSSKPNGTVCECVHAQSFWKVMWAAYESIVSRQ